MGGVDPEFRSSGTLKMPAGHAIQPLPPPNASASSFHHTAGRSIFMAESQPALELAKVPIADEPPWPRPPPLLVVQPRATRSFFAALSEASHLGAESVYYYHFDGAFVSCGPKTGSWAGDWLIYDNNWPAEILPSYYCPLRQVALIIARSQTRAIFTDSVTVKGA